MKKEQKKGGIKIKTILEAKEITKTFPGVKALDNVSFNLKEGEVHALLGENGAGKSTMMKVFSGVHQPDSGSVSINGKKVNITSPKAAMDMGIGIIYQELNLCPHLTVAQNIFLCREPRKGMVVDRKKMNEDAKELLDFIHAGIDPDERVSRLSVSKRQMVEIAKAVSQNIDILIMDEPTSSLSEREVKELFEVIRRLKNEGKGIIYISHKLDELEEITDRVSIFRDGRYITTEKFEDITMDEIISHMVGRDITEQFPRTSVEKGEKLMEVKGFSNPGFVSDINFDLYEGEILGVSGLVGSGRTELFKSIFGALGKPVGKVSLRGKILDINQPSDAIKSGIVYVSEDRKKEGLALEMSVKKNMSFPILKEISSRFLKKVDMSLLEEKAESMVKSMKIKTPSLDQKAKNLSGGNQQKVVIGKWLLKNPKVIILDEPTRGIDVNAKVEIYKLMNELKGNGIGVIMISSELPELLGITDRTLVMKEGKITACLETLKTNQEEIMSYST